MKLTMYQVDAFTEKLFGGNPAAVCPLESWLPTPVMQAVAAENNLAETAFFVREGDRFEIRWFTPAAEVDLCGHATLASAHVLFHHLGYRKAEISFRSQSGELRALKKGPLIYLDFPAHSPVPAPVEEALTKGLGKIPGEVYKSRDYLAVFGEEADVVSIRPDFSELLKLDCLGIIATAPGASCDFVSRFFAPRVGVPEDPVTGSAHTLLIPYWAKRLGKNVLRAVQVSKRRGDLSCEFLGARVLIGGRAVTFFQATVEI